MAIHQNLSVKIIFKDSASIKIYPFKIFALYGVYPLQLLRLLSKLCKQELLIQVYGYLIGASVS